MADFAAALGVGGGIAPVRIAMAFDAGHGTEVISLGGGRRSQHHFGTMALAASRRQVAAQQLEARLLVASQGECGWPESIHGVALFATIRPRLPRELASVRVFMTIQAGGVGDFVARFLARRNVTLGAFHRRVFSQQRIRALLVHAHIE